MAAGRVHQRSATSRTAIARSMFWMGLASMLPDADVIAFALGIPYEAPFGHRGASHALLAAPILALIPCVALDLLLRTRPSLRTWIIGSIVVATHGLLDSLTDGGLGIALLWPFSNERFFAPWQPIPVAPIGRAFFSRWGLEVALTELAYFAPLFLYALWGFIRRGDRAER
jgi:inner membrane protein